MSARIVSGGRTTFITIATSWKPRMLRNQILGQRNCVEFRSPLNFCYKGKAITRRSTRMAASSIVRAESGDGDGKFRRGFEQEGFINGFSNLGTNGLEATLNHLSKWLVTALFGLLLLWRHDPEALWAASGSVINAGLSTVLKRILNQERPVANVRSDPGMPSSHAQAISFAVMFAILSLVQWLGLNGFTVALSGLFIAVGSYFSWLRVSQQLHTVNQVIVGALLGTGFAILWFWLWDSIVLKAFTSYAWVRIMVALGATVFCVCFLLHVLRYWVMESVTSFMSRKL